MIKRGKKGIALLLGLMILGSTNLVHAETKQFSFTVKYGQQKSDGCAQKADHEQIAYVTATSFSGNRSKIAVGVRGLGNSADTGCWTFTKQNYKNKMKLGYEYGIYAYPGKNFEAYCEGFGSGVGTVKGRYTP
ncbi:hypothetical protein [Anaerosacchariphilus polymeriproducens]|uniref:Uncharacterized protein n=1 Tax=Anaerosacchariphilus polymeriproducens TaxID=1812858 RepID=A0A371AY68_9FIRM|nr:hypothetical protein [Anaerosacchariphilus polymeriproducens]RDU24513.1 hypothetical protein DWV06_03350 [Anaerosacchariphilus polymeriproducens]